MITMFWALWGWSCVGMMIWACYLVVMMVITNVKGTNRKGVDYCHDGTMGWLAVATGYSFMIDDHDHYVLRIAGPFMPHYGDLGFLPRSHGGDHKCKKQDQRFKLIKMNMEMVGGNHIV